MVIEPGVRLRGRTRIGAGTVVGAGCILTDAVVETGVTLKPYTRGGGRAHRRPGHRRPVRTHPPRLRHRRGGPRGQLRRDQEDPAGQGIEGQPPHLPGRRGDRRGRERRRGTITCNYDGEKKHPTRIGDGVFIGSDSILVAPIAIGEGAYVAAGLDPHRSECRRARWRSAARGRWSRKAGWHGTSRKSEIKKAARRPVRPGRGSGRAAARKARLAGERASSQGGRRTMCGIVGYVGPRQCVGPHRGRAAEARVPRL